MDGNFDLFSPWNIILFRNIKNMPVMTKNLFFGFAAIILALIQACGPGNREAAIQFEYVDPLEKVLAESAYFPKREALSEVVRGEHASLQFAVRSSETISGLTVKVSEISNGSVALPDARAGFVGYVKVGRTIWDYSRDRIVSPSGYYPDPILEEESINVAFGNTQPVWVTIPVPADAVDGMYTGKVTLTGRAGGKAFSVSRDFAVKVYPVVVEKTSLWVTNWFSLDTARIKWMNGGVPFEPWSEQHWGYIRELARMMGEYRQNVARISPLDLAVYTFADANWTIDFSRFSRVVDIFKEEGVIGMIDGGHIGARYNEQVIGWGRAPFYVRVPGADQGGERNYDLLPISDPQAKGFYRDFFRALKEELVKKGIENSYLQYIADEPTSENVASYLEIARYVKEIWPEVRIIEATHSKDLEDVVDIYVPQLDFMHKDYTFYNEINKKGNGKQAWFYTCLSPKGEYANRFIELPLLKTRYIHWLNFRYNIPGYLHWGLNQWRHDPWGEQTSINYAGNILPGGDSWIIYPKDGKLLSSVRYEAMRDGIVDYELLKMLEAKNPEKAREIAGKVIFGFDRYDNNVDAFRKHRREVMELLSQ
jgi:hypothetical protein